MNEFVSCQDCHGKKSHSHDYSQFFYHTSATALRNELGADMVHGNGRTDSLGSYLSRVEEQSQKSCDQDEGRL